MLEYNREQILNDMTETLDDWGVDWEQVGVERNLDLWAEKKEWLINILRRHPNWNERAMGVVFTTEEERILDKVTFIEELKYLTKYIEDESMLNTTKLAEIYNKYDWEYSYAKDGFDYLRQVYYVFLQVKNISSKASEELIINLKGKPLDPDVVKNFKPGMKTSRIINALLEPVLNHNDPEIRRYYNQHFAKCADALNPMKVTKYTILSVHPADFLNMSYGTGWKSCHALDGGCYQGGGLSYMADKHSMILYTVANTYQGDEFFTQRKINRQIYCLGKDYRLLQSRLYPQNEANDTSTSDNFRANVQAILSVCLDIPNLWKKTSTHPKEFFFEEEYNMAYTDWYYPDEWYITVSYPKDAVLKPNITYIGGIAHCLKCGDQITETGELYCYDCIEKKICAHCGCVIDSENDYIMFNGDYYCGDCYFYCEYHQEDEPIDWQSEHDWSVCQDGFDKTRYICEYCDAIIDKIHDNYAVIDGHILCDDCYTLCNNCDESIPANLPIANYFNLPFHTDFFGDPICDTCYEEYLQENDFEETDEDITFIA